MKSFRILGLDSVSWTLRRYHVPVDSSHLVLEVGSGGNPYPRANVLVDAYENTQERHWTPLVTDRKTVIAFGENLPFKEKTFDFVICSHVLEHSPDPAQFLAELQRVAKAGYIEVPHAFLERVIPYNDHRLEIHLEDNVLKIFKKPTANKIDPYLEHVFLNQPNRVFSRFLISKKPFDFHVRYFWEHQIDFELLNPEQKANWKPIPAIYPEVRKWGQLKSRFRQLVLCFLRWTLSQNSRNKNVNLETLLFCHQCQRSSYKIESKSKAKCQTCDNSITVWN